jgi:molybdenum cofactor biosynthesis enzyme
MTVSIQQAAPVVDITDKPVTGSWQAAGGHHDEAGTLEAIRSGATKKGDVIAVAQLPESWRRKTAN